MQTLPVSRLIDVSVNLSPIAAQAQSLSDLLVLGSSDVIDVTQRLRTYTSIADVAAEFGTSAPEYLAAVLWFEQSPQPNQLKVGRWAKDDTQGTLRGGVLSTTQQAIATWNAITTGAFFVYINGVPKSINGLNFSAATNLNGVASTIQTALDAATTDTTCVWDSFNQLFQIQSGTAGDGSTISFLEAPTATGYVTFSINPVNTSTITLNGTAVTFVSGSASGNQVHIGADLATTMASLLAFLQASTDTQLLKFEYMVTGGAVLHVNAATSGTGGNSLTIAASVATPSGATLSGGTGVSIAGMLAMLSSSSGAYTAAGIDAETAVAAVTVFDGMFGQGFYAVQIPEADDDDHQDVAAYIEACNNKHVYGVTTTEAGVLSSTSTTDIAYILAGLEYKRTIVQYSSSNEYAVASLLARALTVNYNGNNTVITLMYKQEPGITAEAINASQVAALETKNCNVFVKYNNNTAIIEQGRCSSGNFIDEITGTDWLAITIMNAIYNLLYTSPTKVPQTDAGAQLLTNTCESVCSQAAINGLLGPGVWNSNGFGTLSTGDFLPKGYYIYAPPLASQLQSDREARISVPIQIAAKLAGAVHTVDISITVNR